MQLQLRAAGVAAVMAASVTLASVTLMSAGAVAQNAPLKVGLLSITTGPYVALGTDGENGLRLLLEENSYTLAGTKIELEVADTSASPATALARAQELVSRRGVNLLIGPIASGEALAISDYTNKEQIPVISHSAIAEDLTQRKAGPWYVRAPGTTSQMSHIAGDYAAKTQGYKRIATIATDFAYGHEVVGGFHRAFEEGGGKIVKKIWAPFNAIDFGSYISQIGDVDAVYASFSGPAAVNFLRQYREFGYKDRIPLLTSHSFVDESILSQMGSDANGIVSAAYFTPAFDDAANREFVKKFTAKYGAVPGYYATGGYIAALMLKAAMEDLKATGGSPTDKNQLMKALKAVKISSSPRGPFELDAYGNPIAPIHIRKVETVNGTPQNIIVAVVPRVSQFWHYTPEEFLKNPVYSRDFPPANNLGK